jgi:hypothetical protein
MGGHGRASTLFTLYIPLYTTIYHYLGGIGGYIRGIYDYMAAIYDYMGYISGIRGYIRGFHYLWGIYRL